jgi:hypothetical protein
MEGLVQLDKLSMVVIVDNESDGLSQPCGAADPSAKATERAGELSHACYHVKGCSSYNLELFLGSAWP